MARLHAVLPLRPHLPHSLPTCPFPPLCNPMRASLTLCRQFPSKSRISKIMRHRNNRLHCHLQHRMAPAHLGLRHIVPIRRPLRGADLVDHTSAPYQMLPWRLLKRRTVVCQDRSPLRWVSLSLVRIRMRTKKKEERMRKISARLLDRVPRRWERGVSLRRKIRIVSCAPLSIEGIIIDTLSHSGRIQPG